MFRMTVRTMETIASTMMMVALVALFIIDLLQPYELATYLKHMDSHLYMILTIVCAVICAAIFYMHIKHISTQKWKRLITATSVVVAVVIIPMHFYLKPRRWDFEFRLLFAIDFIAITVFLLFNFLNDMRSTILVAIFIANPLLFVYLRLGDRNLQPINSIITNVMLAGVYFIVFWLYVKHVSNRRWKIVVILVFFLVILIVILLFHFGTLWGADALLYLLIFIDGFSAFVLWLWMYIPIVRNWWKEYSIELDVLQNGNYEIIEMAGLPTWFAQEELNTSTGNFQTPIGEGGSGAIFKGVREDGSTIAVKWIKGIRGGEQDFMTELTIIANLQHVNLVHLLGYSISPKGDRFLIYPFFKNGSLDSWLFAEEEKRSHLTWELRYNIAISVAKALAYLHHEYHTQILHLDIKPANILLDEHFGAVLSDFGISKSIGRDESSVMTRARGTVGYLPPEMLVPNAISTKCDVYSYGLVLLELVGGRKNFQSKLNKETQQITNTYFPKIAREKMIEAKLMEIVDQSLLKHQVIREEEVTILVQVALWCIHENPELRPTTTDVIGMLEGRIPVKMPPESQMFVMKFLESYTFEGDSREEENALLNSVNTISISIQSGR